MNHELVFWRRRRYLGQYPRRRVRSYAVFLRARYVREGRNGSVPPIGSNVDIGSVYSPLPNLVPDTPRRTAPPPATDSSSPTEMGLSYRAIRFIAVVRPISNREESNDGARMKSRGFEVGIGTPARRLDTTAGSTRRFGRSNPGGSRDAGRNARPSMRQPGPAPMCAKPWPTKIVVGKTRPNHPRSDRRRDVTRINHIQRYRTAGDDRINPFLLAPADERV